MVIWHWHGRCASIGLTCVAWDIMQFMGGWPSRVMMPVRALIDPWMKMTCCNSSSIKKAIKKNK